MAAEFGKGDHALGFEHAGENILKLPHRECGAAHIVELSVVGEEIEVARIVGIGRAVACDVQDDLILWLGLGEKGE